MNDFDISQLEFLNSYWNIFQNTTSSSIEKFKSAVIKLFVEANQISIENLDKFIDSVDAEDKIDQIEKEIDKYEKEIKALQAKIKKVKSEKSKYECKLFKNICKKNATIKSSDDIDTSYSDPCSTSLRSYTWGGC